MFKATDENDLEWRGRKVALAMGEEDIIPEMVGYEECAPSKLAIHLAKFANRLANKVKYIRTAMM